MDFTMPPPIAEEKKSFRSFLGKELGPFFSKWYQDGAVPRSFFGALVEAGWFVFHYVVLIPRPLAAGSFIRLKEN